MRTSEIATEDTLTGREAHAAAARVGERRRGRPRNDEMRRAPATPPWSNGQPLLFNDKAAMRALSMKRTKFNEVVRDGRLAVRYIDRARRFHRDDIALFAATLPTQPQT